MAVFSNFEKCHKKKIYWKHFVNVRAEKNLFLSFHYWSQVILCMHAPLLKEAKMLFRFLKVRKILSFDNLTLTVKNLGPLFHPWHQHESKARAWKGLFIIFADPYPSNSIDQTSARVSLDINIAINSELSTAFNVPSVKRLDSSMVLQLLIFSSIAIDVMKWWLLIIFAKRLY